MSLQKASLPERLALLSAWIEAQMAYAEQPGLSVGIVHDQELVWARGFGWADMERQEPADPHTLYRIASITKLFTATALLQLRDAGRLQLDDPLQKYLPWFTLRESEHSHYPVTIRHLITHTSGLPREAAFPYWTDSHFPTAGEIQERLPSQQAIFPPETKLKYSNLALALAGEVVTAVSGIPYADYVQSHILDPLGMQQTLIASPEDGRPGVATGYSRRLPYHGRERSPHTDAQGLMSAFNMSSSVQDLARFMMLQFRTAEDQPAGPEQILCAHTLREMQRVHFLGSDWKIGWGLGFSVWRREEETYVGHGGAVLGHRTLLQFRPADKIGVIVLTNADDGNPLHYLQKAFTWVAPALIGKQAQDPMTAPAAWEPYLGKYRNAWQDTEILLLGGRLKMVNPSLADPLPLAATLHPAGEHRFRIVMDEEAPMAGDGELVVFEFDEHGRVTRLRSGENYLQRIEQW
jgi:CubicO group peptidase (beta-lactamase class C family)